MSRPTQQHGYLFHSTCRRCKRSVVLEYTQPDRAIEVRGTVMRTGAVECGVKIECVDCGKEIFRDPMNMGPSGNRCMNCLAIWELS